MSGSGKVSGKVPAPASRISQARKMNHLKDEVYREMLLLEVSRPGAEMGLALALLRAIVQSGSFRDQRDFGEWLRTVCPLGLHMIEASLEKPPNVFKSEIENERDCMKGPPLER